MADFDDVQVAVASIAYYLYRLAGCPFGDNLSGYQAWMEINLIQPFNALSERSATDD